jgi:hypothetical protein
LQFGCMFGAALVRNTSFVRSYGLDPSHRHAVVTARWDSS